MDLFDLVVLAEDRPDEGLAAGSIGTIVHVFHQPDLAYEVEFTNADGSTLAMLTLRPDELHPSS